jgi:hypothetical protein
MTHVKLIEHIFAVRTLLGKATYVRNQCSTSQTKVLLNGKMFTLA